MVSPRDGFALLTVEDQNGVKLDAGTVDSGDGSNQSFPGDGADIRCIFGTQIVDQQVVQSGYAVPLEGCQIVFDRVIQPLGGGNSQQSIFELGRRPDAIGLFKIQFRAGNIGIAPARLDLGPGQFPGDIQHTFELIEHDVLEVGIMAKDDANVGQCIFDTAGPIQLQLVLPVLVGELGAGLRHTILGKHRFYPVILQSQLRHGGVGRKLANGQPFFDFFM